MSCFLIAVFTFFVVVAGMAVYPGYIQMIVKTHLPFIHLIFSNGWIPIGSFFIITPTQPLIRKMLCASIELSLNSNDREKVESLYQEKVREDHSQYKRLQ